MSIDSYEKKTFMRRIQFMLEIYVYKQKKNLLPPVPLQLQFS